MPDTVRSWGPYGAAFPDRQVGGFSGDGDGPRVPDRSLVPENETRIERILDDDKTAKQQAGRYDAGGCFTFVAVRKIA